MSDPLTDPRAADLLAAKPDQIDALRVLYDKAAGNAQYIARGLRAADRSPRWTGKAADRFHDAIGHIPHQLDLVTNSYWEVADALQQFSPVVLECQQRFKAALGPGYETVTAQLSAAVSIQDRDIQTLSNLTKSGASEAKVRQAKQAVDRDVRAVTQMEGEIHPASRRAFEVLDDFETARARTAHKVALASTITIVPVNFPAPRPLFGDGGPAAATIVAYSGAPLATGELGLAPAGMTATSGSSGERVEAMTAYANQVMGTPYVSGGGHGAFTVTPNGGLDCSGFVSGVLHSAGYLNAPQTTETMYSQPGIVDGPGRYVTIYDRTNCGDNEHVIIDINGHFYEEGGGGADGGAADVHAFTPSAEYLQSFNRILHPVGL